LAQQKKARKVGRPKLAKGEAKGRIVPVRFNPRETRMVIAAARANGQSVSEWLRDAVWEAFTWIVECKNCGREFMFSGIDRQNPRQVVENMPDVEPAKPPIRNGAEQRTCPHCNSRLVYERNDLRFKALRTN
jgi:hypothetical protein